MKKLFCFGVALCLLTTSALAQKAYRVEAVERCVTRAQQQMPSSGAPNDPVHNRRYNIYAACMRELGHNP